MIHFSNGTSAHREDCYNRKADDADDAIRRAGFGDAIVVVPGDDFSYVQAHPSGGSRLDGPYVVELSLPCGRVVDVMAATFVDVLDLAAKHRAALGI